MMLAELIAAVRFLTRIPLPGAPTTAAHLPGAMAWFPLIGGLCGALIGAVFMGAAMIWPVAVAAVLAVTFGLLLTGAFHEDGCADSADGLGGGFTRERTLEIFKDSRIGTYGACALLVLLGLRVAALCALGLQSWWVLALAALWGRWTAAPWLRWLPPAGQGFSKDIAAAVTMRTVVAATMVPVLATAAVAWWFPLRAALTVAVVLLITWCWGAYLRRRLGGQTGDVLGAGNQLVEAMVLLTWLARPDQTALPNQWR